MENTETQIWIKFAFRFEYASENIYDKLLDESKEIGRMINYMMHNPEKFT